MTVKPCSFTFTLLPRHGRVYFYCLISPCYCDFRHPTYKPSRAQKPMCWRRTASALSAAWEMLFHDVNSTIEAEPPQILRGCSQEAKSCFFFSIPRPVPLVLLYYGMFFNYWEYYHSCITTQHLFQVVVWIDLTRASLGGTLKSHSPEKVTFKRSKPETPWFSFSFLLNTSCFSSFLDVKINLVLAVDCKSRLPRARCIRDGHAPRGEKKAVPNPDNFFHILSWKIFEMKIKCIIPPI